MGDQEIAEKVYKALKSLDRLRSPDPLGRSLPDYDDWGALLYSVWYQPSQINLAHMLSLKIFDMSKFARQSGYDRHEILDFGCGALAMQFGLALAFADLAEERGVLPNFNIAPWDASPAMISIGRSLWTKFVGEIDDHSKHPELYRLRQVLSRIEFGKFGASSANRWLTALHVAYKENAAQVKEILDAIVNWGEPNVILITAPSVASGYAYTPGNRLYRKVECLVSIDDLPLGHGKLKATTTFRKRLYYENIESRSNQLSTHDLEFVKAYLTIKPTLWSNEHFDPTSLLYIKK